MYPCLQIQCQWLKLRHRVARARPVLLNLRLLLAGQVSSTSTSVLPMLTAELAIAALITRLAAIGSVDETISNSSQILDIVGCRRLI